MLAELRNWWSLICASAQTPFTPPSSAHSFSRSCGLRPDERLTCPVAPLRLGVWRCWQLPPGRDAYHQTNGKWIPSLLLMSATSESLIAANPPPKKKPPKKQKHVHWGQREKSNTLTCNCGALLPWEEKEHSSKSPFFSNSRDLGHSVKASN